MNLAEGVNFYYHFNIHSCVFKHMKKFLAFGIAVIVIKLSKLHLIHVMEQDSICRGSTGSGL